MILPRTTIEILFLIALPLLIESTHHLHSFPALHINPNDYPQADLILHSFRHQFPSTHSSSRCLLQTESKYFHVDSTCQLLSRTALNTICPLNYTLKLEIVLPQNTTVYELVVSLSYPQVLHYNISQSQSTIELPFTCNETREWKIHRRDRDISIGNARIHMNEQHVDRTCQFEKNPYRMKLKENEFYKEFLQVKSSPLCSSSTYVLAPSNSKRNFDYFMLNSSTGLLSLIRPLDYESIITWKLVIQGHDQQHIPFYTYVIIDVLDVNDCAPLLTWNFPLPVVDIINDTDTFHMQIAIDESKVEQSNVVIANLIASDLDLSLSNDEPVKFELRLNTSSKLPFDVHGPFADSTFVLSTNEQLDREVQDTYELQLILTDQGQPRFPRIISCSYGSWTATIMRRNSIDRSTM
jgi:hypothetical protein